MELNRMPHQSVEYILKSVRGKSTLDKSNSKLETGQEVFTGHDWLIKWEIVGFAEAKVWWVAYSDDPDAQGDWFVGDSDEPAVILKCKDYYSIARTSAVIGLIKAAQGFNTKERMI